MQLSKDNSKSRRNKTGTLIIEGPKNRNLVAFLKIKLFVENLREAQKSSILQK